MNSLFSSSDKIYFIGIGGIGVSAIAKLAMSAGATVYGSDLCDSDTIRELRQAGACVSIGRVARFSLRSHEINQLIYSTAVAPRHPLIVEAKQLRIKCRTYPQALGAISKNYLTVAVSGMHGKSTTTAMIGRLLESAGRDPLVIVGTKVKQWNGNVRSPKSVVSCQLSVVRPIFVVEADEYRSAMLQLTPAVIVLTRVEEDHLDYYRDISHIKSEFIKYLSGLAPGGVVIANAQDKNIADILSSYPGKIIRYNVQTPAERRIKTRLRKILTVPGTHNLENALAAYHVGKYLSVSAAAIYRGLAGFTGTWRRLELVGTLKVSGRCVPIISDYGHHPTEVAATLQAIREKYPKRSILLAYQPHQHNRTKKLFDRFMTCFDQADQLILVKIFDVAGREVQADQNVSSKTLAAKINARIADLQPALKLCVYAKNLAETTKKIRELAKPNDVIVIMGAGDIDSVARFLIS